MRYFSLFTGVGGFELAMPKNFECVGTSEIDRYASDVLRYHYPETKNYGDITKINWADVPDFDLLVGGSPCQDLSVAGKQRGLVGLRSGLFYEYTRALKEKKPTHFIWENVKGALSSNGGRDFANILLSFSEAGYSLWWSVLNAKDFGVPQNRERVFIVGSRNGSPREVFFEREGDGENIIQLNQPKHSNDRIYGDGGIAPALNTMQGGRRQPFVQRQPLRFLQRNQKNIEGDYAFTVDAGQTSGVNVEGRIRKLTPLECERLMSWPDNHTKYGRKEDGTVYEISDSQRYKMCGNGVVSKVVAEVIKQHLL